MVLGIGNLTQMDNAKKAWEIMERQNQWYLEEDWNTTANKIAEEGEDIYFEKLPKWLADWTMDNVRMETELFLSIQAVGTDMEFLELLLNYNTMGTSNIIKRQWVGWVWHLLHTEW